MTYEEWVKSSKRVAAFLRERIPYHSPKMDDALLYTRLIAESQKATYALAHGAQKHEVNLPFIVADFSGPKHLNCVITQEQFKEIVGPSVILPERSA